MKYIVTITLNSDESDEETLAKLIERTMIHTDYVEHVESVEAVLA
jgi:hypothetical protein